MKEIGVISIWTKRTAEDSPVAYSVRVEEQPTQEAMLDAAFVLTNRDDRPLWRNVCSTSIGDVLVLDNQPWLVDKVGFKRLTSAQFEAVKALTSRDTSGGFDWLIKQGLIQKEAQ